MRTIGSDELRLTLGQVIDQVAAGEKIIVTRRGTPRIRLSPVAPGPPVDPPGLGEDQAHER
ncbi:MAG TPA: type II toxin-antitoxin system prevent-host-death family antitoxin [Solirubrobacteraceae bacterium]|nr:type II toxin-antitoxin system prevent-host-death family antitoxin [Solirubrobacteraceae bacterium]